MTITVQLFQDTGAVTSGHGTTRIPVNNIGWKNSGLDETNLYVFYPITRPIVTSTPFGYSVKQYHYGKISGTYAKGSRMRMLIRGNVNGLDEGGSMPSSDATPGSPTSYEGYGKNRLYYKLTNTYEVPSSTFDGTLIYLPPNQTHILLPRLSTTGPEAATSYLQYLTGDQTYYTEYLVTQLFVENGDPSQFGNIGELRVEFTMDEYESTYT